MRKGKKKIAIVAAVIVIAGIMAVLSSLWIRYHNLEKYAEKVLDIDWGDCIEASTGEIEHSFFSLTEEESVIIKFTVKQGYEQEVVDILEERCGEPMDISYAPPGIFYMYELGKELEEREIQFYFACVKEGKRAKSRWFEIFVATDDANRTYIYWFG